MGRSRSRSPKLPRRRASRYKPSRSLYFSSRPKPPSKQEGMQRPAGDSRHVSAARRLTLGTGLPILPATADPSFRRNRSLGWRFRDRLPRFRSTASRVESPPMAVPPMRRSLSGPGSVREQVCATRSRADRRSRNGGQPNRIPLAARGHIRPAVPWSTICPRRTSHHPIGTPDPGQPCATGVRSK